MARGRQLSSDSTHSDDDKDSQGLIVDGQVLTEAEADADKLGQEQSDDILSTLSALDTAGEVRWQITRLLPASEEGYLFDLTTAELTLDNVKKRAGPGKYRASGKRSNGKYVGSRTFVIGKELNPPGTSMVLSAQQPNVNEFLQFIDRQKLQSKEDLKFWAGLLVPFLAPLIAQLFVRKESSMIEMVTALKGLKGMTDGDSSLDQLAKTKQLIELVKDMAPEDKGAVGSTWPDIVRDGLQAAGPVLASLMQSRAAALAAQSGQPLESPPPITEQPGTPPMPLPPAMRLLNWFRAQLPMLTLKAAKNADPELYAEVLADNLPEGITAEQLHPFLSREDWWTMLQSVHPAVMPYEGWFTTLRNTLITMIDEARSGRDDPPDTGA